MRIGEDVGPQKRLNALEVVVDLPPGGTQFEVGLGVPDGPREVRPPAIASGLTGTEESLVGIPSGRWACESAACVPGDLFGFHRRSPAPGASPDLLTGPISRRPLWAGSA